MAIKKFEDQLVAVNGKVRRVNMWNAFDRYHDGLLYHWNNAEKLRDSAKILWASGASQNDIALMLAGLSIELLLKGTILGLQDVCPHCHQLDCLIATAGISVSDRDHQTSRLLTEYIVWAARYPTPRTAEAWFLEETGGWPLSRAPDLRDTNQQDDYESLWNTLAPYFWRVQEGTRESADLNEEDIYQLKKRPKVNHKHAPRRT
jgi:HEPN domain-containing protein